MTLNDLIAQLIPDPAAQGKLRDAIARAGGNLAFPLATVLPANTDLAHYAWQSNTDYVTVPLAPYFCTPTFALTVPGVRIVASGNPLAFPAVAGAGTGIELRAAGITLSGFTVTSAPPGLAVARIYAADCKVDLTINVPVASAAVVGPGGDRANISFKTLVPTGGQNGYVVGAQDVTFHDCFSAGSLGEDCIRFSADAPVAQGGTGKRPARGRVLKSELHILKQQTGSKQSSTVSFRDMDDSCEISDCTLEGWVRVGQDAQAPTAFGLKFNRNHCLVEPHGFDQLVLVAATMSECDGNAFDAIPAQRPLGYTAKVSKPCVPTNNTMRMVPTGAPRKLLMIANDGTGATDGSGLKVK